MTTNRDVKAQIEALYQDSAIRDRKYYPDFRRAWNSLLEAAASSEEEYFPPEAVWTRPEGGFFVWVTLPQYVDANSMLAEALDHGVIYAPGDSFFPDGKRGRNSMRLNFSYESPENIEEAIRRLSEVIEDRLELYRAFIAAGAIKE